MLQRACETLREALVGDKRKASQAPPQQLVACKRQAGEAGVNLQRLGMLLPRLIQPS